MSSYRSDRLNTQNDLLMTNLLDFFKSDPVRLTKMMNIINGESRISLRIVDWFVTNFAKKYYVWYTMTDDADRFKVYTDYKLKLKAYSKRRFDPFCRWERTTIPYDDANFVETTIGQLNFFKWAIENQILEYIQSHFDEIEEDMNERNTTSRSRRRTADREEDHDETAAAVGGVGGVAVGGDDVKTRKKREELSESACKCIKKEMIKIVVKFT
jgi:hypothetical protein